jgi:thioredoxin 1
LTIADISYTEIDSLTRTYPLVILEFWAHWCETSQRFAGEYENIAEQNRDVIFVRAEIGDELELAERFEIDSVPTLIGFQNSIQIFKHFGAPSQVHFNNLLDQLRSTDVDELFRRELGLEPQGLKGLFKKLRR